MDITEGEKICCIEGCNAKHHSLGYCSKHYQQISKYGKIRRTIKDLNEIIIHDDYAEIVLYKNNIEIARTSIDKDSIDKVKDMKWNLSDRGYVISDSLGYRVRLHRFLLDIEDKYIVVDHIDRNPLNNKKSNLRQCNQGDNVVNANKPTDNTSGFIGVWWHKKNKSWIAEIKVNKKKIHLGCSKDINEVIKLRLKAEKKYFGDFAPQKHLFSEYGIE